MHKFFFSILFLVVFSFSFSQQKYQSLLWKISGNGLEKPSYLYGTMHVSKKVAFRLDDVFYKALNESECIALESDPTTWPEFNYEMMMNEYGAYNNFRGDFYNTLFKLYHPKEMAIRNSIRMDNNVINSYLYRKNNVSDNFEEETYLDMFIFQAGKKNKKEIVGLEDLEESRYLVAKAQYNAEKKDIEPWLQKLFSKENPYLIQENLYRDRNLDLLDSIGAGVNTEYYRENMLYKRNENMVIALEELMPKKTVFAGVGAAHLPGEHGMINMLRERGYTVESFTSKQTEFSKAEKTKLDSLFVKPNLELNSTPDGFLSLNTYDKLREFSYAGQKYYLDPDMTNGAYITINRISRYLYLPNENDHITLKEIDRLLYEDIPGDIIERTQLKEPYPGISIVNRTKKGEFQKYHIYETPLEMIIVKFAGKSDFVLKHKDQVFDSIRLKAKTNEIKIFIAPQKKFQVDFPEYYITDNMQNAGKKVIQGFRNGSYYFLQEAPYNDVSYIEEDSFEAKYFHHAFYKMYQLKEEKGGFKRGDYKTYESSAIVDSVAQKRLFLKTIIKDGTYYLLGHVGKNENNEVADFFKSFKTNDIDYTGFEKVTDTALHFNVKTNIKPPMSNLYNNYSYDDNSDEKDYEEKEKETVYTSKANEQIFINRTKYHDLQMFHNIDSLWTQLERSISLKNRYVYYKKYNISDKEKSNNDDIYTYTFKYWDSTSAKNILIKNILKKGTLFQLKTLIDSISGPSKFVTEFYDSFSPMDTLLGKNVLADKTNLFFKALKDNDSITLASYDLIKFKKHNVKEMIQLLKTHDFPKERLKIKSYLIKEIIKLDLDNNLPFIKQLYIDSYSDPQAQITILDGLLDANKTASYKLLIDLMDKDLPLSSSRIGSIFYSYGKKDSLALKQTLFPDLLKFTSIEEYKQPIYNLLSKLKDSSLIKPKLYSKHKEQLINDGKTEIKRSLSKSSRYSSYSRGLSNYVKLIFPFRKEKKGRDFFEKLLNCDNKIALTMYYVLLVKANEPIPLMLKEKTLRNEDNQYVLLQKLEDYDLLKKVDLEDMDQKQFVKSKLRTMARFDEDKDSLSFVTIREFRTDKGQNALMYFFKVEKHGDYRNSSFIHAMAFIKPRRSSDIVVRYYYKTDNTGVKIDETKSIEEQYAEIIDLAAYKDRKRLKGGYNDYYDY